MVSLHFRHVRRSSLQCSWLGGPWDRSEYCQTGFQPTFVCVQFCTSATADWNVVLRSSHPCIRPLTAIPLVLLRRVGAQSSKAQKNFIHVNFCKNGYQVIHNYIVIVSLGLCSSLIGKLPCSYVTATLLTNYLNTLEFIVHMTYLFRCLLTTLTWIN